MKKHTLSIATGCIFILYVCIQIGALINGIVSGSSAAALIGQFIRILPILLAGIMFVIRKGNVVITIAFGIMTLIYTVFTATLLSYQSELFNHIVYIGNILVVISHLLLTVMSILSYKKPNCAFLKLWFLPAIINLISLCFNILLYIYLGFLSHSILPLLLRITYTFGLASAGLSFYKNGTNDQV